MSNMDLLFADSETRSRPTPAALFALQQRMEAHIGRLQRTARRLAQAEFQRGGDDLDVTAMRVGHEADQALRARCAESLPEWIAALRRLRDEPERFGLCDGCGRPMPWERVELLPTARRCAAC